MLNNDKRNVTNFLLFLIKYGEIFFCFFLSSFSWYLNMDIDIDLIYNWEIASQIFLFKITQ